MNQYIEKEIHQIRNILSNLEGSDFPSWTSFRLSSGFPAGCCGDATDLLGLYLVKYHHLDSEYICGTGLGDDPNRSHAWLKCQGYIIDITADQFNKDGYQLSPIIIEKQSAFHELFSEYESHPINTEHLKDTGIPSVLENVLSVMGVSDSAL